MIWTQQLWMIFLMIFLSSRNIDLAPFDLYKILFISTDISSSGRWFMCLLSSKKHPLWPLLLCLRGLFSLGLACGQSFLVGPRMGDEKVIFGICFCATSMTFWPRQQNNMPSRWERATNIKILSAVCRPFFWVAKIEAKWWRNGGKEGILATESYNTIL